MQIAQCASSVILFTQLVCLYKRLDVANRNNWMLCDVFTVYCWLICRLIHIMLYSVFCYCWQTRQLMQNINRQQPISFQVCSIHITATFGLCLIGLLFWEPNYKYFKDKLFPKNEFRKTYGKKLEMCRECDVHSNLRRKTSEILQQT